MKKLFVSLSAAAILAACVSVGSKFDMADVDAMQPGQTTIADAKAKLGLPNSQAVGANGVTSLLWSYVSASPFGVNTNRGVIILFDKDGKMIRVAGKSEIKIN